MPSVDVPNPDELQQRRLRPIRFAGEELWLHASGALFWPAQKALVVSDLHLEKGSFLSAYASPLPLLDTRDTLGRLQELITRFAPREVICLGDSFHDANALTRMGSTDLAQLQTLTQSVSQWVWILGNHDPDLPQALPGLRCVESQRPPLLFVHQPDERHVAQVVGHYHPKMRYRLAGQTVRGSCFVQTHNRLYMPAFGSFTGGLDVNDKGFPACASGSGRKAFLLFNQRVWQI